MDVQGRGVHLVAFQADPLRGGRVVEFAVGGIAETDHRPIALGRRPAEHPVGPHALRQVQHLLRGGDGRPGLAVPYPALPRLQQAEFAEGRGGEFFVDRQAPVTGGGTGEGQLLEHARRLGIDAGHLLPGGTVLRGLDQHRDRETGGGDQDIDLEYLGRERFGKVQAYGLILVDGQPRGGVAVNQNFPGEIVQQVDVAGLVVVLVALDQGLLRIGPAAGDLRSGGDETVGRRIPVGHHGHVAVEALFGERLREAHGLFAAIAFHESLPPGILFHRGFGGDPGAAALGPAVAVGRTDLHAEPVGFLHRVAEHRVPLRAVELDGLEAVFDADQAVDIEDGGVGDALGLHRFEVLGEAFAGDGAVHPVPPGSGLVLCGRSGENGGVGTGLREQAGGGQERGKEDKNAVHHGLIWFSKIHIFSARGNDLFEGFIR